jgi:hypothetical protein
MATDHAVEQGESVISIAYEHGFSWKTIWNHPQNAELKRSRVDPDALLPGDVLHIPDLTPKVETGATEKRHTFQRNGTWAVLRLVLRRPKLQSEEKIEQASDSISEYRQPEPKPPEYENLSDTPYALYVDGMLVEEGKTGSDGKLEVKISPVADSAWLVFDRGTPAERTLPLNIRHMDPIEELPGVIKRLNNLGIPCSPEVDEQDPEFAFALREFQARHGLQETGRLDDQTRSAIKDAHGG